LHPECQDPDNPELCPSQVDDAPEASNPQEAYGPEEAARDEMGCDSHVEEVEENELTSTYYAFLEEPAFPSAPTGKLLVPATSPSDRQFLSPVDRAIDGILDVFPPVFAGAYLLNGLESTSRRDSSSSSASWEEEPRLDVYLKKHPKRSVD
jgi:hypothetical protein